jgi:hypothetical protein
MIKKDRTRFYLDISLLCLLIVPLAALSAAENTPPIVGANHLRCEHCDNPPSSAT